MEEGFESYAEAHIMGGLRFVCSHLLAIPPDRIKGHFIISKSETPRPYIHLQTIEKKISIGKHELSAETNLDYR